MEHQLFKISEEKQNAFLNKKNPKIHFTVAIA